MPLRASRLPTACILLTAALPAMFTTLAALTLTALVLLLSTTLTALATALTLPTTLSLVLFPAIALTGSLALTLTPIFWVAFLLCLFLVPCHSYLPLTFIANPTQADLFPCCRESIRFVVCI
jgi:hypothetical protein